MFKRKCKKCKKIINKKFDFCPYCGTPVKNNSKGKWGFLGKDDTLNQNMNSSEDFFGSKMLNKFIGNAMKMIEKEIQKDFAKQNKNKNKKNLQIYINGKRIPIGKRKVNNIRKRKPNKKRKKKISLPEKKLKNFSKLPKETPQTNVKRLSDSIIYEINIPGVKSKKRISIRQLENSIEIKAVTNDKKKAYHKTINVGLPIVKYNLKKKKQKLILELATK